ncbi:TetR family transcriptional regulator [Streptomyces albospinus]|uniref:TetR family transcriptional regulator n=1 Tax=Streptomyces albospinus TaxID=285515 RepID=A0ABQ2V7A1_9ACTN|nr:TetR/AcrR family transcriptional regulator [Streptomyces albospinus]GGU69913.1 TetR family transcriptional regulator [Streptomyces albospinus]
MTSANPASDNSLRERLIDVGVDLVTTDGPDALGLREIARRAGVSHGAPRRYFPTHRALLSAIARRGFAELGERIADVAGASGPPREQVAALARAYVGFALERRGMFELMFRHDLLNSEGEQEAADGPRLRESTVPLFRMLVERVARCGGSEEAGVTAAALWANLHGIAQLWRWGSLQLAMGGPAADGGAPDAELLDRLLSAALDAHLGPVTA